MRLLAAFLVLLLLPIAVGAPGPNPRAPVTVPAQVLALGMADDGRLVATTDDPGNLLPTPGNPGANVNTWHTYSALGVAQVLGNGDLPGCGTRPGDLCQSPVVAAAYAANGTRFAFASNVAMGADGTRAVLAIGDATGIIARQNLANPVVAVAMDASGSTVAVLERVPRIGSPDTAQVEWFRVSPSAGISPVRAAHPLGGPPVALALALDGGRLVAAADRVYSFTNGSADPIVYTASAHGVAIAQSAPYATVWGTAGGEIQLATTASASPLGAASLGSVPVTAVAASRDGKWAAGGNAEGHLRVYALNASAPTPFSSGPAANVGERIQQMAFTADARFLMVRSLTAVRLYLREDNLTLLWEALPAQAPVAAAVSANGDYVAAAYNRSLVVYTVSRAIRAEAAPETMLPGQSRNLVVRYHNDGNRPESAQLEVAFPPHWFAQADRLNVSVPVGGFADVELRVILPAMEPPGKGVIRINHTLQSTGAKGTTNLEINVASRELIVLGPNGPLSVGVRGGETVEFAAVVENRGNLGGTVNVVMTSDPPSWRASLSDSQVTLAPGESRNLTVQLTAPNGVVDGDAGHVRLVLAERPDEPVDYFATVGARFRVALTVPPLATVEAGGQVEVPVTVQNLGNVIDSVDLSATQLRDGWNVVFTPGNETIRGLTAGATAVAVATILAPADAVAGLRVPVTVVARSQGNPSSSEERMVLVGVTSGGVLPPEPEAQVPWAAIGVVALAVVGLAAFVGGYFLLRRK